MTAQIPDAVRIEGERFDLCEVRGDGLFEPADHGITTEAQDTACWRGFVCGYSVTDDQLVLDDLELRSEPSSWTNTRTRIARIFADKVSFDDELHHVGANGLAHPIPFTGTLFIGTDFVDDLYVHSGFQEAHHYRKVLELTFEGGRLLAETDRSEEMAAMRRREDSGDRSGPEDPAKWIDDSRE